MDGWMDGWLEQLHSALSIEINAYGAVLMF
jgi:hypothetical protein